MRYCTALVPVRQKPGSFEDNHKASFVNISNRALDGPSAFTRPDQRQLHLDIERHSDDALLLQEISKKYILIPKLRLTYNDFIQDVKPNIDDNTDWKSKYYILDQLKKSELEGQTDSMIPKDNYISITPEKDIVDKLDNCNLEQNEKYTNNKSDNNYKQEYPKVLHTDNKLSYELENYQPPLETDNSYLDDRQNKNLNFADGNAMYQVHNDEICNKHGRTNVNSMIETATEFNNQYTNELGETPVVQLDANITNQNIPKTYLDAEIAEENNYTMPEPVQYNTIEDMNSEDTDRDTGDKKEVNIKQYEVNTVKLVNPNNYNGLEEIDNVEYHEQYESEIIENAEHPMKVISAQEHVALTDNGNKENSSNLKLQGLIEDINITKESHEVSKNVHETINNNFDPIVEPESNLDNLETFLTENPETYGAEPNEAYYNQDADKNHAYTQGVVENYNTEYSVPDQNIQQDYAAYYEGGQQQPYTNEVNEHEETSQVYDQNYEQQYGSEYDQQNYEHHEYEQYANQGYEQQQQEYIGQEILSQAQQGMDITQFENQDMTPQNVEQQLDNEQGYMEQENTEFESTNVEKQDMEEIPKPNISKVAEK